MLLFLLTMMANPTFGQGPTDTNPDLIVTNLRTEYVVNPLGIDASVPRMSWQLVSQDRDVWQSAYQIRVAQGAPDFATATIWDTGRLESSQSIHVDYGGPALASRRRYYWQVRVWTSEDEPTPWSEPAFWEMGLLDESDWTASWISSPNEEDPLEPQPVHQFRRAFDLGENIRSARLYVTSLGLYEMELNDAVVGNQVFTPGWTSYDTRLQYQVFDVTDMLTPGPNAIGAWLADGWYRGYLKWDLSRNVYGDRLGLLAQLEIEYSDGRRQVIETDGDWKSTTGPILMSDIYMGEAYDARREQPGWSRASFDDSAWVGVDVLNRPHGKLIASIGPPVRRIEEVTPVGVSSSRSGHPIVDLGQNIVGRVRIFVDGPTGTEITLRHAEVLDPYGELYTANLRDARAQDTYILRGGGPEFFEPRFTFHGFRYVEMQGYPGELKPEHITGIVIHSDMPPTGSFTTSDSLINRLQENIVWGQKGNFLDVPTDCPQRDERLGWTGDAQVFSRTAAFNMDVAAFFTKWLGDVVADQKPNGSVPWVVPDVISRGETEGGGATGWGDAAVVVPWTLYLAYGDTRVIERQYGSMMRWVDFMRTRAGDDLIWSGDTHFGDWLAFASGDPAYPGATTSTDLLATAYFAHSVDLLGRMSQIIGRDVETLELQALFERIRSAFQAEFFTKAGRIVSETQTAYAMALAFDLVPLESRQAAIEKLADDVRKRGHLTTGFLGTPLLTRVLSDNGHLDLAYALLNRREYPSWLYPVTMGATTVWERWDSQKPDGSFQDPGMNSFNHYAYGAIGDWMYRVIGGIEVDEEEPGYRHAVIHPQPGGGLTSAHAALQTMYGMLSTSWRTDGDTFQLNVEIPPNTTATVLIPDASLRRVTESGRSLDGVDGIHDVAAKGNVLVLEVGSGTYHFVRD